MWAGQADPEEKALVEPLESWVQSCLHVSVLGCGLHLLLSTVKVSTGAVKGTRRSRGATGIIARGRGHGRAGKGAF